ncbi:MAG: DNA replication and repair protein RecF [Candidatus Sumerlaeia bacterium]
MHLTAIAIRRLRNLERLDWQPPAGLSLVWGDNGQGKTNLLEAIHLALTGRSFRTRHDEEMLPWGTTDEPTRVQASLIAGAGATRLSVAMGRGFKRVYADGQWLARLIEIWPRASVITFAPEDADLMKGPPAARRRFIDMVLARISPRYLDQLQRYQQALRRLNALYKTKPIDRDVRAEAEAYWAVLAESGATLIDARRRWLAEAAPALAARLAELGCPDQAELGYDPDLGTEALDADEAGIARLFRGMLGECYFDSRRLGTCQVGAHRDDFSLRLGGHDLRRYGSQGQHRLIALALKLESAAWIRRVSGESPILLLDDFGSELDPARRASVLAGLAGSMQVIVTATSPKDFPAGSPFDARMEIIHGKIANDA